MSRPRHVLLTCGGGFVVLACALRLLEADPALAVTIVDRAAPGRIVRDTLAPFAGRVALVTADVCDDRLLPDVRATHVVHGASVTSPGAGGEAMHARAFVDVNVGGTVNVLEWARARGVRRLIHLSSGAVYGDAGPASPAGLQDEDGPFGPRDLYAVSKLASELVARRYGELFALDVRAVRLSGVFGALERPGPARQAMSPIYHAVRAAAERRPLRVSARSLAAAGDWISAVDVADAVLRLLDAGELAHPVYNVAAGVLTPFPTLLRLLAEVAPGATHAVDDDAPEVDLDPALRRARHNAYAIARIVADVGWRPRPLALQLAEHVRAVAGPGGAPAPPETSAPL